MKLSVNKEKFREIREGIKAAGEKKYTILLVDDEDANIRALTMLLENEYHIITAHSGPEALSHITTTPNPQQISLIISDQRMADMTGVEFFKQTLIFIPECIRILLTGYTDVPDIIDAINEGQIYKYLTKPIEPTDLLITVKRALESYELARQKRLLIEELQQTNENLELLVQERTQEIQNKMDLLNREIEIRKQTESALREIEKTFEYFTENSPDVQFLWDLTTDFPIFISPSISRMTGYTVQEVRHNRRDLMMTPESMAYYLPLEKERTRSFIANPDIETEYIDELEYYKKDGTTYRAEVFKHYKLDKHGNPIMVGILRDITERKLAEEALLESESFNRGLIENLPDYIVVYDHDGIVQFVNPAFTSVFGYTIEDMKGMTLLSLVSEEYRDDVAEKTSYRIKGSNPPMYETDLNTRDNKRRSVIVKGTSIHYHTNPAILLLMNDITERKRIEQALKENEAKFISIFEETPDPILIVNSSDQILDANRGFENIFGWTTQEIVGTYLDDLAIQLTLRSITQEFDKSGSDGTILHAEMNLERRNGTPFIAEVSVSRIIIQNDPCLLIQIHDIDEIRRAHNAVYQVNNKLKILSSITRHDILNRIMVTSAYSDLILEKTIDEVSHKRLEAIKQSSEEIQALIEFTGQYQDLGAVAPEWQQIDQIIKHRSIQDLLKGVQVTSALGALSIYADLMLEKVMYNLVENSVRHGQNLSRIHLSCTEMDESLHIWYEDDGGGIVEAEKEKVFEKGFGKNTGLGLFLIREILSISGITISEIGEPGVGVRFEMVVPRGGYRYQS